MILHIKNMVSSRCKLVVQNELDKLGLPYESIDLGEVKINGKIDFEILEALSTRLTGIGLAIIEGKRELLVEKIKHVIIEMVHEGPLHKKCKNSEHISIRTGYDYTYLSNVFSEETGMTIEHFIICHKIERTKELIVDNELNLTEISYLLKYSSVAHLSHQFKQITGITASHFRHSPTRNRIALENI